jgi:hypothetical protein
MEGENLKSYIGGIFENRAPRKIFGPKRDEVTGGWRKLHDELHKFYAS